MKKLLIVIDMQNDFLTGSLANAEADRVTRNVADKLAAARKEGVRVVFTRDTHGADYLSTQEGKILPVEHCIKGTKGWEIAEGLYEKGETVFDKPTFGSLELAEFVREGDFDEVELIGVCTDICVVSNATLIKAYSPELALSVDASCCAGVTKESHDAALQTMKSCQINVNE